MATVQMNSFEERARKILEHERLRQSAQGIFRKPQEALGGELLAYRRLNLRGAIGKRQNHVSVVQPHALLVVGFTSYVSQREALKPFPQLQESPVTVAPEKHPRMRRIRKVEFATCSVKSSRDDRGQPQRTNGLFVREGKRVVQGRQQTRRVPNVLKFVEEMMDVPGDSARGIAMADAIRQNHARDVIAAGEYRG